MWWSLYWWYLYARTTGFAIVDDMKINIRLLYLYLFSFVGLVIIVISSIKLIDLGLKYFVFKDADRYDYYSPKPVIVESTTNPEYNYEEDMAEQKRIAELEQRRSRQRDFSNSVAMLFVGIPLYYYHWRKIAKENSQ